MVTNLGQKIKELRLRNQFTLQDVSDRTGLSAGFLSQLERGLTSVAVDSLAKIAKALNVELTYFFQKPQNRQQVVVRGYDQKIFSIENNRYIHFLLSENLGDKQLVPRIIEILPCDETEELAPYQHEGEEFVYVLEGVLTLKVDDKVMELYPGDSAHYLSTRVHNWTNYTNRKVRILAVHTPNYIEQ